MKLGRLALAVASSLTGCAEGQDHDLGSDAQMLVRGGSFVRGPLPASSGGPAVEGAFLGQTMFPAAFQNKSFSGSLGEAATALGLMLDGDVGYWLVAAGPPFVESPTLPSFDAPLSFSRATPAGPHTLTLSAVDEAGRFGATKPVPFTLTSRPLEGATLVFSLYWDRSADLDLHVVLPDGTEVYKDEINSWEPSAQDGDDPQAFESGGQLDIDSNAQCRIDGKNAENVSWHVPPPAGLYLVRVDTFDLCGESSARFQAEARLNGERVALTSGQALPSDTRGSHGRGAGVTAFELEVE